jgi:hypothetical protein
VKNGDNLTPIRCETELYDGLDLRRLVRAGGPEVAAGGKGWGDGKAETVGSYRIEPSATITGNPEQMNERPENQPPRSIHRRLKKAAIAGVLLMAAGGAAYVTCTTCFRDRATARDASNPLPYPFELPGFQERTREKLLRTKVALDFDKAKLHVLIDAISKACDVEIRLPPHLDEDVLSRTLSLKVKDLSGYNALALVLGQYGLAFEIESQGYIRVMRHSGDYLSNGVIRERQRLEEIRRGEHEDDREKEKKEQFAKKAIGQVKVTLDFENQQLKK